MPVIRKLVLYTWYDNVLSHGNTFLIFSNKPVSRKKLD